MRRQLRRVWLGLGLVLPFASGCQLLPGRSETITMLVGSALGETCAQASRAIAQNPPRLEDGTRVLLACRKAGSGDVVSEMEGHARAVLQGGGDAADPRIPTLLSVDGEIYQELLRQRLQALAPSQQLIPPLADTPALASSPMVLMTTPALAKGLRRSDPYQALARSSNHRQLDAAAPSQPIRFVHTAPTRSNSGLQTVVAMVSDIARKPPEQLRLEDVRASATAFAALERHITRYGSSTQELADAMRRNGPFWASVASVYESSVVGANGQRQDGGEPLVAVYPPSTYTSTMRAILPRAPWVSPRERQAARLLIDRLQQPDIQKLVAQQGLRPANPSVPASRVNAANGVDPKATYNSLRAPRPEVVEAIIRTWRDQVKKPSRVALVVDSSGSMVGGKLPAVQSSLQAYLNQIGPRDVVGLIDFDSDVQAPVVVRGGGADRDRAASFVAGLRAEGATRLYDAVLAGRNWLRQTRQPGETLAVVVLTDGEDSGSPLSLQALMAELQRSGFRSDERIGVFTMGYGQQGDYNAEVLRQIAQSNGGEFLEGTVDSVRRRMDDLQMSF
ncbi:MAG: extracellular solute-binding protein [Synechococcaceae cyanobacterium]